MTESTSAEKAVVFASLDLHEAVRDLRTDLAERDRTISELRGYAQHLLGCDKRLASSAIAWDLLACSCGLQALLDKHEALNSPGGTTANEVQEQAPEEQA